MSVMLGKLPPDILSQSVLRYKGAVRNDVIVGGGLGEDAALIEWPTTAQRAYPYLIASSDPVVGAANGAGKLLVDINANDIACKGGDPSWFIVTLIAPANAGVDLIERIMREVHEACAEKNIAVVGGHTEISDRYEWPVIVGTMMGPASRVLNIAQIQPGDEILATAHVGLEGMSILGNDRPDLLTGLAAFTADELATVRAWSEELSVLPAARIARNFAHYMHDPTEGGLVGALLEVSASCKLKLELDRDAIPISPLTLRASKSIGFDPLHLISSGMLLAVIPPEKSRTAQEVLAANGIESKIIGRYVSSDTNTNAEPILDMHEELWGILARESN